MDKKSQEPFPNSTSRSLAPVYATAVAVFIYTARVPEIIIILQKFRPALFSFCAAFSLSMMSGRFTDSRPFSNKEGKLALTFFLLGAISIPFSSWPGGAFETWASTFVINLLIYCCCFANMRNKKELNIIMWSLVVSCLFLGFSLHFEPKIMSGRQSISSSYDSNDLALVFVSFLPIAGLIFLQQKGLKKIIPAITVILGLAGFFKTGSRGGFLGFIAIIGVLLLTSNKRISLIKKLLIVLAAGGCAVYLGSDILWEGFAAVWSGEDYNLSTGEESAGGRLAIWSMGIKLFLQSPIIGEGAGQYTVALGQKLQVWKAPHNSFLQVAVELGIGGLVIYCAMLHTIWKKSRDLSNSPKHAFNEPEQTLSYVLTISLTGFAVCSFFLTQALSAIIPLFLAFTACLSNRESENVKQ